MGQKIAIMTLVITFNCLAVAHMCPAQSNQLDGAIERLGQLQAGGGAQVLDECMASIRQHMPAGDFVTWCRLRAILEQAERPVQVQLAVLNVAAEKSNERIALDVLDVVRGWVEALSRKNTDQLVSDKDEWRKKTALVYRFLDLLDRDPLAKDLGARLETLELLRDIATDAVVDPRRGAQAVELIYKSKAPLAQRRAVAETIVSAHRTAESHHHLLLKLLDRSSFPQLRELVRQSSDPAEFHFAAAAALGHLGDREIVSDLEALRPAFLKKHVNLEGMLVYYLWQIDVQHPPSKLTEYIASPPEVGDERRLWAIRRATELGAPKPQIRKAILAHAEQVKPNAQGIRPNLASIKMLARSLGILEPTDLPEVKTPSTAPTP